MIPKSIKNFRFSKISLLLSLILLLAIFIISCGFFHNNIECHAPYFLPSQIFSGKNPLVYSILLALTIYSLITTIQKNQKLSLSNLSPPSLPLLLFWQFVFKIYNPILEAFRRGIIHPQIYKFKVISN